MSGIYERQIRMIQLECLTYSATPESVKDQATLIARAADAELSRLTSERDLAVGRADALVEQLRQRDRAFDLSVSKALAERNQAMDRADSLSEQIFQRDADIEALRARVAELEQALHTAEAALADIGDADREPGDDLAWCEKRAAAALPGVRSMLAKDGA